MPRGRPKLKAVTTADGTMMANEDLKMLNGDGSLDDLHPFIMGLLQELPVPGTYWAPERRSLWLATATSIFQMIYTEAPPLPTPPVE
jgi:hypothetical protein